MTADLTHPAPPMPTEAEVSAWLDGIINQGFAYRNTQEYAFSNYVGVRINEIQSVLLNMDKNIATKDDVARKAQLEREIEPYKRIYDRIKNARDLF